MKNKIKKLITHNGSFHADDIFAAATLSLFLKKEEYEIIRTRDEEIIKLGDYVFDVGGIYDENINRFDHHQKGGAGKRENDIPYASFGLVWKHFGMNLCEQNENIWKMIDQAIVCPIDANDNGLDIVETKFTGIMPYSASRVFLINSPTWKENEENIDKIFLEQVKLATKILKREIKVAQDDIEGKRLILESYNNAKDKRIIELDISFPRYLYQEILSSLPEPIFVVYPSLYAKNWKVEAISKNSETMESRKYFPISWRGFLNNDHQASEIIGVSGVIFSHQAGFLITISEKENALELAKKALAS